MKTILRVTRENEALKDDVKRLRTELEEAKRQVGGFHGDIFMYSAVNALLHQARSLSNLVFEQNRYSGCRAGGIALAIIGIGAKK